MCDILYICMCYLFWHVCSMSLCKHYITCIIIQYRLKYIKILLLQLLGGTLCAEDVDNLKKWTPQVVSTLPNNLAPQGYKDAYYLARRYRSRFPTLLKQQYNPKRFTVSTLKIFLQLIMKYHQNYNDCVYRKSQN